MINYHFCHFRQCVHFWTYLENIWYYHLIDNVIFIIIFILLRSTPIVKIEDWNRIYRRHADIVEWQDQPFCRKNTRSATVKEQTNVLLREILVKTVWAWKCFKWIIEKILKSAIFVEFMQIVECVILLSFLWRKIPSSSAWYHASTFVTILSGPLAQWAERGADNAKAVSSILTGTTILVSPFFCSCISRLQPARVTDLLITGQLVLAGAPLNNFWVFIQFQSDQSREANSVLVSFIVWFFCTFLIFCEWCFT